MARAQGARALMALAFETTYGTPPASGFILAAQAQKHVTHNEALRILDGLVQLGKSNSGRNRNGTHDQERATGARLTFTQLWKNQTWPRNEDKSASGKPGAVKNVITS